MFVCCYLNFTKNISVDESKTTMKTDFEITNLGMMKYFIDIEVNQSEHDIFICQNNYAKGILKGLVR
jgi:hypothetical protein